MNTPTTIFIDTCIFDESAFNLKSARFVAICSLAAMYKLKLLIPDPTDREIRRHIKEHSRSAVKSLKDAARRAPFLNQLKDWPLNETNEFLLASKLEEHIKTELTEFYGHFEVYKLDYAGVDISEIMNWHDWEHAPFSGRKKCEFPDALSVASLNNHYNSSSEYIAIISCDGDFKSVCETQKHFLYFPSLPAYTEAIQSEDDRIGKIHILLSNDDSVIKNSISKEFPNLSFLIEADWDGEVENIKVSGIDEIEYYIVGVGHHNYIVSFNTEISFSADVSYWDYDTAIYDSGEAYPIHKIEGRTTTNTSISGTLRLAVDESEENITSCSNIDFEQDYISVGDDSYYF